MRTNSTSFTKANRISPLGKQSIISEAIIIAIIHSVKEVVIEYIDKKYG